MCLLLTGAAIEELDEVVLLVELLVELLELPDELVEELLELEHGLVALGLPGGPV